MLRICVRINNFQTLIFFFKNLRTNMQSLFSFIQLF